MSGTTPTGIRTADLPNLGALTDSSIVVGDRSGTGSFLATALSAYVDIAASAKYATQAALNAEIAETDADFVAINAFLNIPAGGTADDTAALQAAVDAANPGGYVNLKPNTTYTITSKINLRPGVRIVGPRSSVIRQANGANLTYMLDCSTYTANGVTVAGITIDGNLANNSQFTPGTTAIYVQHANDVVVDGCALQNMSGVPVYVLNGLRPRITNNTFQNYQGYGGAYLNASAAQTKTAGLISGNNFLRPFGGHAVIAINADWTRIIHNYIDAQQVTGMTVSVSGTTVTSSGTGVNNFLTNTDGGPIQVGSFIVAGDGGANRQLEMYVTAVVSASQLTVTPTSGTRSNYAAIAGPGDLISLSGASFCTVHGNEVRGGATGGIVCSDSPQSSFQRVSIDANNLNSIGNCGISLQSVASGNQIFNIAITNNVIGNCGQGASATILNVGIGILTGTDPLVPIWVDGNFIADAGSTTTQYWMQASGGAGAVLCGRNATRGLANPGIFSGTISFTLSAGWGAGATVGNIVSQGSALSFQVLAGASGLSANPTITVSTCATWATQFPVVMAKVVGSTDGTLPPMSGELNVSPSSTLLTVNGTPTAGATYSINVVG